MPAAQRKRCDGPGRFQIGIHRVHTTPLHESYSGVSSLSLCRCSKRSYHTCSAYHIACTVVAAQAKQLVPFHRKACAAGSRALGGLNATRDRCYEPFYGPGDRAGGPRAGKHKTTTAWPAVGVLCQPAPRLAAPTPTEHSRIQWIGSSSPPLKLWPPRPHVQPQSNHSDPETTHSQPTLSRSASPPTTNPKSTSAQRTLEAPVSDAPPNPAIFPPPHPSLEPRSAVSENRTPPLSNPPARVLLLYRSTLRPPHTSVAPPYSYFAASSPTANRKYKNTRAARTHATLPSHSFRFQSRLFRFAPRPPVPARWRLRRILRASPSSSTFSRPNTTASQQRTPRSSLTAASGPARWTSNPQSSTPCSPSSTT